MSPQHLSNDLSEARNILAFPPKLNQLKIIMLKMATTSYEQTSFSISKISRFLSNFSRLFIIS